MHKLFTVHHGDGREETDSAAYAHRVAQELDGYIFSGGKPVVPQTFALLHDLEIALIEARRAVMLCKEQGLESEAVAGFVTRLGMWPTMHTEECEELVDVWEEPT